jgi:lipopolysaccharide transport system permease protein
MEYEIKAKEKFHLGLGELVQYRELFYYFAWRDIKVKYKQTILGFAWAVLQPLFMMLIFSFFFGKMLDLSYLPYPVFVFSGLLMWNIFSSGLTNAGNSMVTNANIIKKIYFPRLIIPISSILVALFDFMMAFLIFIGIMVYYHPHFILWHALVFIPGAVFMAAFASLGPGMLLAALNAKYRDVRYIIPFLIQMLLFLTPVIYPVDKFNNPILKIILSLNPVSGAINLFRSAISYTPFDIHFFLISCSSGIVFFVVGLLYFRKTETFFADVI